MNIRKSDDNITFIYIWRVKIRKNDDNLEESSVKFIERVNVGEEKGQGLLRHRVFFRNLVPEPLRKLRV